MKHLLAVLLSRKQAIRPLVARSGTDTARSSTAQAGSTGTYGAAGTASSHPAATPPRGRPGGIEGRDCKALHLEPAT